MSESGSRLFKLVSKKYSSCGLGSIDNEAHSIVRCYTFDCEFEGGIKAAVSVETKEDIERLRGLLVDMVWDEKVSK